MKHELLLIAAALVITITALLYSVFDSPKYNAIEAVIITTTEAQTNETTAAVGKININTAAADELSQLEGIGDKKAQAIIEHREKNGRFRASEELTDVSGISASILEKNIERIAV
ncbi:MAG: ComEA family DNA-binding protein [Clostridia bacterium]|nr:ComEA family DNA-binding protein [Clostridia bacterium]